MKKKVIIYTQAYNAADTINRAICSVRNQTYDDWVYFVVDNGSSDGTGTLILNAAMADTRIIPYCLERNDITVYVSIWSILSELYPNDYIMQLDADDELMPDALEKMVSLMQERDCDIVACGTAFTGYDECGNPKTLRERCVNEELIIEDRKFADLFKIYRSYTNELWAKLYNCSIVSRDAMAVYNNHHYDSQVVLQLFSKANRVGIYPEILHKAYVASDSASSTIKGGQSKMIGAFPLENTISHWLDGTPYRRNIVYDLYSWENVNEAFSAHKRYLCQYGELSVENEEYLYAIYLGWIHENLVRLYLGQGKAKGHQLYAQILGMLDSDTFRNAFVYKQPTREYHNFDRREGMLEQLYNFVSISLHLTNNSEYVIRTHKEIDALLEEMRNERC